MRTIDITKFSQRPHEILLKADLLDKQIVDIEGRKVIRVNDVRLDEIDGQLRVVAVDVGAAGLVRRLGMEGPFRTVARGLRRGVPERYIDWEDVDPLDSTIASIRLRVPHARLAELHPADLADIIDQLTPRDRLGVLASLDDEALADVVEEMEPDTQVEVLEDLEPSRAADILEEMSPDDAADLVADLSDRSRDEILALMEHDEAEEVRDLLAFPEDSAGGLMTTEFVGVPATLTAAETIDRLRELEPDAETIYYVYVVDDDGRLVGVLSLRDLIVARPETQIAEVMIDEPVAVRALEPAESVAETIAHYNLLAVPVVDDEGRLVGHRHGRRRDRHGGARLVAPPPAARVRARGRRRPVTIGRGLRDAVIAAPKGIAARLPHVPVPRLRGRFRRRGLLAFLAVMGPGIIAGVAGNDAGGITTYSVMGAQTGLSLLWIFPVTIVMLAIVQEMVARLGVVTGQGLSDLIRERFGVRWTLFAMLVLLVANVANTVANFGGAAACARHLRHPQVDHGAGRRGRDLGSRAVRELSGRRAGVPAGHGRVPRLPDRGRPLDRGLAAGVPRDGDAGHRLARRPLAAAAGRRRRHHDHALHAVLPAVGGGGEGHRRGGAAARAGRRRRGLGVDQRDRDLHRRRLGRRARGWRAAGSSRRPRTRRAPSSPSRAGSPRRCSASGCSGRPCWRRRSCRSRPRS